jgi:tRNA G46 methylase TrmB
MSFQGLFETARKRKKEKVHEQPTNHVKNQNQQQPSMLQKQTLSSRNEQSGRSLTNKKRKRQLVSQEALALSAQLKDLSRQKRLDQVLHLYWNAKDRDAHHACMVIDCCARCGHVAEAERVFQSQPDTSSCNVEMHTALLKAFAHAGQIYKADALFSTMCEPQSQVIPNVRTLNTLLRGCLWTATCIHDDRVVGGVVTSEKAWKMYVVKVGEESLDASSNEYSTSLLCQALRVQDAMDRIEIFMERNQIQLKGKASFRGGDHTSLETLAVVYMSLAKAYGLLNRWDDTWMACQRVLNAAEGSRLRLASETVSSEVGKETRNKQTTGGKKSWNDPADGSSQRLASNSSFRSHRLSELEMEARMMLKLRSSSARSPSRESLSSSLLTRLLYFSGGGTTELDSTETRNVVIKERKDQQRRLLVPAWYSFGLSSLVDDGSGELVQGGVVPDPKTVYKLFGLNKNMKKMIREDGRIKFDNLFLDKSRPIDVELGSGFGEWIAKQAETNQTRNYVAVELRADRVSQIFIKSTLLLGLDNVCVVGSDCASFLRHQMPASRISNAYINHPEPPTQTLGDNNHDLNAIMNGASEPAHMLCSSTLQAIANALKIGGKIIIVSDNRWYSRLICATFAKVNRLNKCKLMPPSSIEANELNLQLVEQFENGATLYQSMTRSSTKNDGVGTTWFDRLWQTGAGRHAERSTRFAIVVTKQ